MNQTRLTLKTPLQIERDFAPQALLSHAPFGPSMSVAKHHQKLNNALTL